MELSLVKEVIEKADVFCTVTFQLAQIHQSEVINHGSPTISQAILGRFVMFVTILDDLISISILARAIDELNHVNLCHKSRFHCYSVAYRACYRQP